MENLLTKTKIAHSKRVFGKPKDLKMIITFEDLENGFKLFSNNETVKNRVEKNRISKDIMFSMYS